MKIKADFSDVSEGYKGLPVGDYVCKVTKVELKDGQKAKYLQWELTVGIGNEKGNKTSFITSLSTKALFKLRDFMVACGLEVPKSLATVDTDTMIGKIVGISVVAGTYTNDKGEVKDKTEIKDVYAVKKTDKGWVNANEVDLPDLDTPPWNAAADNTDVTEIEI